MPRGRKPKSALDQAVKSATKEVARTRVRNPWDRDEAYPGGKTSNDVVIDWLTTEGNYARWVSPVTDGKADKGAPGSPKQKVGSKASCIREILATLEKNGIRHRSLQDVRNRIGSIEKQFASAKRWLQESGLFVAFESEKVDKDIQSNVLRQCKFYRELAPHFNAVQAAKAVTIDLNTDDGEESAETPAARGNIAESDSEQSVDLAGDLTPTRAVVDNDEEEEEEGEEEGSSDSGHAEAADVANGSGRESSSNESDESQEASNHTGEIEAKSSSEESGEEEDDKFHFEAVTPPSNLVSRSKKTRDGVAAALAARNAALSKRKPLASAANGKTKRQRSGAMPVDEEHRAILLASAEEERQQRRSLFELERAKLQRELEMKEIQTIYERTLARKKLQDAGVSIEDIDRVLPMD